MQQAPVLGICKITQFKCLTICCCFNCSASFLLAAATAAAPPFPPLLLAAGAALFCPLAFLSAGAAGSSTGSCTMLMAKSQSANKHKHSSRLSLSTIRISRLCYVLARVLLRPSLLDVQRASSKSNISPACQPPTQSMAQPSYKLMLHCHTPTP